MVLGISFHFGPIFTQARPGRPKLYNTLKIALAIYDYSARLDNCLSKAWKYYSFVVIKRINSEQVNFELDQPISK